MSRPQVGDEEKLQRVVKYLRRYPRWISQYPYQDPTSTIVAYTDSDWGGCERSRKSTSGGVIMKGEHLLLHWSRTQQLIALSSAEAELNAAVKACCEVLGAVHMAKEMGKVYGAVLLGDSSASVGIAHRAGTGRVKHLSIRQLWVQERVANEEVVFKKIPRSVNLSDALTHHWTQAEAAVHFPAMGGLRCALQ